MKYDVDVEEGMQRGGTGGGGVVIYPAAGGGIIDDDVVGREETEEDGEEDIGESGAGEETVKVGNCFCLGVFVGSPSGCSPPSNPSDDLPDTPARIEANVSENARFAFLNLGVVGSSPPEVSAGLEEVVKTPALGSDFVHCMPAPMSFHPVGSSIGA